MFASLWSFPCDTSTRVKSHLLKFCKDYVLHKILVLLIPLAQAMRAPRSRRYPLLDFFFQHMRERLWGIKRLFRNVRGLNN